MIASKRKVSTASFRRVSQALGSSLSLLELSQGPAASHKGCLPAQFQNTQKYQRDSFNELGKKESFLCLILRNNFILGATLQKREM